MYLLVDPSKTDNVLQKLEECMCSQSYVYNFCDGHFVKNAKKKTLPVDAATALVERLSKYKFTRIGSARLQPVPPHFGIDYGGEVAELKELVSLNNEREQLLNDIGKIIQLFFYQVKDVRELIIPGEFDDLLVNGFAINTDEDEKVTRVKMAGSI